RGLERAQRRAQRGQAAVDGGRPGALLVEDGLGWRHIGVGQLFSGGGRVVNRTGDDCHDRAPWEGN
ncbi:conserved hypothetical protein, partial [Ricinus communis]